MKRELTEKTEKSKKRKTCFHTHKVLNTAQKFSVYAYICTNVNMERLVSHPGHIFGKVTWIFDKDKTIFYYSQGVTNDWTKTNHL